MNTLPQVFSGIMLLCALALLVRPRLAAMAGLYRLQTLALFAAALAQDSFFAALVALIQAVSFPMVFSRLPPGPTARYSGFALLIGLGLVCVAMLAVPSLAVALAILLLGLLIMVARREPAAQAIGFLSAGNALLLAILQTGQPSGLCLALFALGACLLARLYRMAEAPA